MDVRISLPLLPLRDIVVFPSMVTPLFIGRDKFNEDISRWNVSSVTNMVGMFYNAFLFNNSLRLVVG